MSIRANIRNFIWKIFPADLEVKHELRCENHKENLVAGSDEEHLQETANWLKRAQDSSPDGGVSRAYRATSAFGFGPKGWQASYPETTGYVIPTFFNLAQHFSDKDYQSRALKMAEWECTIQLPSGAVMGSVVTASKSPAVFNTGQVIFGWLAAYRQSQDRKYLESAKRAGDYLLSVQGEDGSWHKGDSAFALKGATTYNARVAWAMIELGHSTGEDKYTLGGRKNIDRALANQLPNGWFQDNCLNDPKRPLLHTIIYATRGILESGICLNDSRYIDAAQRTLDALLPCQRTDGGIPGRLDSRWDPASPWDCLTGDAQAAIAWLRMYGLTGNERYKTAARSAIEFVKKSQNLHHTNLGIRGGVKGSFPFDGGYGQFLLLNWAAKFFCDALLLINNQELSEKG